MEAKSPPGKDVQSLSPRELVTEGAKAIHRETGIAYLSRAWRTGILQLPPVNEKDLSVQADEAKTRAKQELRAFRNQFRRRREKK